jgi:hypothetical protein
LKERANFPGLHISMDFCVHVHDFTVGATSLYSKNILHVAPRYIFAAVVTFPDPVTSKVISTRQTIFSNLNSQGPLNFKKYPTAKWQVKTNRLIPLVSCHLNLNVSLGMWCTWGCGGFGDVVALQGCNGSVG